MSASPRSTSVTLEEIEDEDNVNKPPRLPTRSRSNSPSPPHTNSEPSPPHRAATRSAPVNKSPGPASASSAPASIPNAESTLNPNVASPSVPNAASPSVPNAASTSNPNAASTSKGKAALTSKAAKDPDQAREEKNKRRRERRKKEKEKKQKQKANEKVSGAAEGGGTMEEQAEGDADQEDDDDVHGRGHSGITEKERIEYFEELLPAYLALGNRSREKTAFWEAFPVDYFELFPIELYPPSASTMAPLPKLSEAQRRKMSNKQKDARKKAEKRRDLSPEQRVIAQIKRWFLYRQGKASSKSSFDRYLQRMRKCPKPPRKLTLAQFLQHHSEHKTAIKERSEETGHADRLAKRSKAAREYVEDLTPELALELEAERDEQYALALQNWQETDSMEGVKDLDEQEQQRCRENFPRVFQPLLDAVAQYTGMSVFLMAGLELDHPTEAKSFDAVSMCSVASGCPKLDKYDLVKFSEFASHFLGWLHKVEKIKLGIDNPVDAVIQAPTVDLEGDFMMFDECQPESSKSGGRKGKGVKAGTTATATKKKTKAKKARKGKGKARSGDPINDDKEGDEEDDDEEDDEDEDDGNEPNFDAMDGPDDDEAGPGNGSNEEEGVRDEEDGDDDEDDADMNVPKRKFRLEYNQYELDRMEHIENVKKRLAAVGAEQAVNDLFQRNKRNAKEPEPEPEPEPEEPPANSKAPDRPRPQPRRITRSLAAASTRDPASEPVPSPAATSTQTPAASQPVPSPAAPTTRNATSLAVPTLPTLPTTPTTRNATSLDVPTLPTLPTTPIRAASTPAVSPRSTLAVPAPAPPQPFSLPPITFLTVPESSVPPTRAPSTTPSTRVIPAHSEPFVRAYTAFNVEFDPVVDKVGPEAYAGCDLVQTMGEFLLTIPSNANGTYKSRSTLYEAVVHKWMELEAVLAELGVKDTKTSNANRPEGFQSWFKNGRVGNRLKASVSLDIPPLANLPNLRLDWWRWFGVNMPDWMARIDNKVVPGGDGDWEDCEMPGKDGMVLFLVALRWWFDLAGKEDEEGGWVQAAKAVYYTLDQTLLNRRQRPPPSLPAIRPCPDSASSASGREKRSRIE